MDPTLRIRTIEALKEGLPQFSPQLKVAAKYIVDHASDFGLDPIRDTARKANVSTYTLVKMAKNVGFPSFEAFRQPFRHALVAGTFAETDPEWLTEIRTTSPTGTVFADAAKNAVSIVSRSLERQTLHEIEQVTKLLASAPTVYVTAVRSTYAVAYHLHYAGRMALPTMQLIPRHRNSAIDDLNEAQAGDVLIAITVTPYSMETIQACKFAQKKGVKLVLITDSEVVSAALKPEFTLVASVLSSHHFGCLSGMMSVIELLLAFLMQSGGQDARDRIKSYEKLRIENNAYWIAQKKH